MDTIFYSKLFFLASIIGIEITFFLLIIDTKELALAQYSTNQRNITSKIKSIERAYAPILITVKNETSSDSNMNLLEKAYVPISAAIIAGTATALGVLLPIFLSRRRKQVFESLIFRELQELSPYPKKKKDANKKNWHEHHQKGKFVHQNIFNDPTENRDFIFSLDPALVYYVTQLRNTIEPCREDSAVDGFAQTTDVANGFSDLILSLYGSEIGMHARSAIGVQALPLGLPVIIDGLVEIETVV